ncbi:MauE/DoxX family redox-associated membrane protein [Planobispora longispora]|uniref:Methylamine utilization protein MauE n=1 Tax=Planobispora longispora TaxID=28887 RepID=A0A8J3RKI7_9ACTN|nr:MauE/DoxX family redox-associated membrane protein [Planobispora longispora]GIH73963.1 methylamine utilization protein MauE [Planobispora longispora]
MDYLVVAVRCALFVVFAASLVSKVRGRVSFASFTASLPGFGVPAGRARGVAGAVVAAEAAVLVLLALPDTVPFGFALATALLAVFSWAMARVLRRGARVPCRCFGASATPVSVLHVTRNLVLACAALTAGAFSAAAGQPPHPAGLMIAAATGAVLAALVITLDDIAGLFTASPSHLKDRR